MPITPILRLALDITGTNPDNRIIDEPHTLSNRPTRSIAPNHGPFFATGLQIRNGSTVLVRGVDYQIVELHQEATLLYGKEIASVILIINSSIPSNVTISYQALGGHYSYSDHAIANMYQSVINDNRPVDWSNVFNKPTEFNPTIHRHLLDDIFGFEPIVDYLERIKRAITLGQASLVVEIVNLLLGKFRCGELQKILPTSKLIQHDALLYFITRKKILNNIWIDVKDCNWFKGQSAVLQIDTSGYPIGTNLYWELYKPSGAINLFSTTSGKITANGGIAEATIYVPANPNYSEFPLYAGVKESLSDEDYKAVTYVLDIVENIPSNTYAPYLIHNFTFDEFIIPYYGLTDSSDEYRLYSQTNYL